MLTNDHLGCFLYEKILDTSIYNPSVILFITEEQIFVLSLNFVYNQVLLSLYSDQIFRNYMILSLFLVLNPNSKSIDDPFKTV